MEGGPMCSLLWKEMTMSITSEILFIKDVDSLVHLVRWQKRTCDMGELLKHWDKCDTMHSNSFPFVLVPLRRSLCLFWRETHTKGLRARSPARLEVEEGREVWEKTERGSWQSRAEETSQLERAVKRRRRTQSTEVSMASDFCGSFVQVHARISPQNAVLHRLPPSCAWSWPKSVFVRLLFFSSTLLVVFYVSVKKCVMPQIGDEKKSTRWITGHE